MPSSSLTVVALLSLCYDCHLFGGAPACRPFRDVPGLLFGFGRLSPLSRRGGFAGDRYVTVAIAVRRGRLDGGDRRCISLRLGEIAGRVLLVDDAKANLGKSSPALASV